ncbi:pyrroline-5-carboxylate reductase family protein [Sphingomonas hankyongi]|uniref:Pyrroline-5-carboxylate reductase n=1 Tax=Sphingomonas hankyongi TaxID=2908209 RepID=A0ABT0S0Q7_9SPHN|nr:pyrroline-5-carboxylate reductase dimerization domain-containing protein [Sphingomonas hankyongi]MCL6729387.1 NAD(P)-binding domain-containing protein [Sphingomonas hankyongi]
MTTIPQLPVPTWFVGCGNMGGAIVQGWRSAGIDLSNAVVIRPSGTPVEGVRTVSTIADAGASPKLIILAVKPQRLDEVADQLQPALTEKAVIVSLLAGVEADSLRHRFPNVASIVRAMPNIPVAIRRGVIGLFSKDADDSVRRQLAEAFAPLGFAPWLPDEVKLAAVGSVAGAGTAYVARFIDALRKAAEEWGLSTEIASVVALETVLGTAWLGATNRDSMDEIVRRVASPNGTTEAGLAVLDRDGVLDQLIAVTIEAAARRGAELAAEAEAATLAGASQLH